MSHQSQRLSPRQEQVLDYFCEEMVARQRRPSQTEIAVELEISRQAANGHVKALIAKGWLLRHGKRMLEPTDRAWTRQLLRSQEKQARARLPPGALSRGTARAICAVRSAMRGLGQESQQMVLDFASR